MKPTKEIKVLIKSPEEAQIVFEMMKNQELEVCNITN